jgi:uncharacterized protein YndB with AHSA1/START domain
MKWLLIGGGIVVTVIVIVIVVGAMLPRDHISAMSLRINANRDAVWRTITDPGAFPTWREDIRKIELLPPTSHGPSWREHSKNGALTMVVESANAGHSLLTRIADENLPFGGTWEYRLDDDRPGTTKITITERGSVRNPVFRFVSRFIMGHTATIDAYLRALGKKFGDESAPVVVAAAEDR